MNRTNHVAYFYLIGLFAFSILTLCNSQCTNSTNTMSTSLNSCSPKLGIQHVLSRRKRYLLFPPGASFVATMSFTKALATQFPRGVNFLVETDFYYPLYSSISELFPKDKTPKQAPAVAATTTPATLAPMTENFVENPKFDSYPGTYFEGSDAWRRKDSNAFPYNRNKEYIPFTPSYMYWQSPKPFYKPRYETYTDYVSKPVYRSPATLGNKYQDMDWRQRELYRSRRHLYSHIEAAAQKHGLEIQSCIHRMICEGRHYLLPPGVSFFQDVLRILLTLPATNAVGDGYSEAMHATEDECLSIYSEKCPYSIVGYILHNQQELNK